MPYPKIRSQDNNGSLQFESPDHIKSDITGSIGVPVSVSRTQIRHIEMDIA